MIFIISPEETIANEIETLHKLFEAGLTHFHFRKPKASLQEHQEYIDQVDKRFHNHIVTHNFHKELCDQYDLMGIHLEEAKWRVQGDNLEEYVSAFAKANKSISSSYHEMEDLIAQHDIFKYYILSPVFSAISKSGMEGRGFNVQHIDKFVAGMGGINAETIPDAYSLGFRGFGTIGGVWSQEDPVAALKEMKTALDTMNS